MITINKDTFEIEVKETLSFDGDVIDVLNEIKDDVKYRFENDLIDEDEIESVKKFLFSEIGNEEKIEILKDIEFEYVYRCHHAGEDAISIFDVEVIESAVKSWIEEKFNFLV